jgi:putative GTP pyrophosphokinase
MVAPPPSKATYSKGEVNRAGVLLLDLRQRMADEAMPIGEDYDRRLDEAWAALTWWRSLYARPLSTVAANLRYHVDKADGRIQGQIDVTQRLKRIPTLIGKLGRERGNVTQMHDIGGVRAVVPGLRHVYAVRRRLLKSWTIVRERDYIENPKDTGYRAMHLIVQRMGVPIEVQLRTVAQDSWANIVEESGREFGEDFKFGAGEGRPLALFETIAGLLAAFDRSELTNDNLRVALQHLPELSITQGKGRT